MLAGGYIIVLRFCFFPQDTVILPHILINSMAIAGVVFLIHQYVRFSLLNSELPLSCPDKKKSSGFSGPVADKQFSHGLYLAGKAKYCDDITGQYFGIAVRDDNGTITQN